MSAQVLFRVKCSTEFSQMVRIVGNSSQLGNWNPQLGFKLMTNNEMYPIWYSDFALEVELDQLVEFKLIITDGLNSFWECGENRCLQIQGQKMVVILTYNMPSIFIYSIKGLFQTMIWQQSHKAEQERFLYNCRISCTILMMTRIPIKKVMPTPYFKMKSLHAIQMRIFQILLISSQSLQ